MMFLNASHSDRSEGYQYAAFWTPSLQNDSVRHATLSRRYLPSGLWETLVLDDYNQTEDDGHDVYVIYLYGAIL